ncbi:hypothetical protein B0H14DRAFT_2363760, partial [Mycena olivaceomarginata]
IESHIQKWTLNREQAQAFRIIAHHSLQNHPEQLRMFLSGPGGTAIPQLLPLLIVGRRCMRPAFAIAILVVGSQPPGL